MRRPAIVAVILIAACTDHSPVAPVPPPSESISDAVHGSGNAHFYFLPPLVPEVGTAGTFDGTLLPYTAVEVCRLDGTSCTPIATFTQTTHVACGPKDVNPPEAGLVRVSLDAETYIVTWDTNECGSLDAAATYRIRVVVAGTELGYADLDVVENGRELRNVITGQYVGLVDGRTLPIKFRIEAGAVFVIGPDGGTVVGSGELVTIRIPEGALESSIGITVRSSNHGSADDGTIPGTVWEFAPEGTIFSIPAEMAIHYEPGALPSEITDPTTSLVLVTEEDDEWVESPTTVDDDAHVVTGPLFGFSVKAVAEKTVTLETEPPSFVLAPGSSGATQSSPRAAGGKVLKKRALRRSSANPGVAMIDASGVVRGVGTGATSLSVTLKLPRLFPPSADPCSLPYVLCVFPRNEIPVVVRMPVAAVSLAPSTTTVPMGQTVQLTVELRDANGNVLTDRTVTWTSVSEDVASVGASGRVTAIMPGTTEIRATSEGVSGSAVVEVVSVAGVPTVPAGFVIDAIAQTPQRPVGLAIASAGSVFGSDLYVAGQGPDAASPDAIYRVLQTDEVAVFAELLPEADPVDLAFAPLGSAFGTYLYLSANNRDGGVSGDHGGTIQRVNESGTVTDFTLVGEASGLTEPRGFAFAPGGPFGADLYVANHVNPPMDIGRVSSAGGSAAAFFEGGLALSDLTFGPGGDFGTDLYLADWEGCSCIRRLSSGGTVSGPFAVLPSSPGSLRFGAGGAFGSDLYVTAAGSIYRVSAGGVVTPFATGFAGLGLDALEFTSDGSALYAVDTDARVIYRITHPDAATRNYAWSHLASSTSRGITEVWGATGSAVFATASEFDILHFDGLGWSTTFSTTDTLSFRGLSGRGPNDVYAVGGRRVAASGSCGGVTGRTLRAVVLRFDGTSWHDVAFPFICNSTHRGAWVGPQTALAVGNSPRTTQNLGEQVGRIWRLRDGSWTLELSLSSDLSTFLHAWGSDEADVYAVGGRNLFGSPETPLGLIAHYDGTTWAVVSDQIEQPLNAVWGSSSSDVFAVGQGGLILHFDGTQWTRQESGVTVNLNGVWGSAPNNVIAVGGGGTILRWDGHSWMRLDSGSTTNLTGVWLTTAGDRAFITGQAGLMLLGVAQP